MTRRKAINRNRSKNYRATRNNRMIVINIMFKVYKEGHEPSEEMDGRYKKE